MRQQHIYVLFISILVILPVITSAQTLYWVGGAGDWHDPNKWSTTSGGFGGAALPSSITNVVFDELSFPPGNHTVTASTDLNCLDLDFRNVQSQVTFSVQATDTLNIDGSLWLNNSVTWDVQSSVIFRSEQPGREIDMAGQSFLTDINFGSESSGFNGEWTAISDLVVQGDINILNGTFITGDNIIEATSIRIPEVNNQVGLDLGNSTINLISPAGDTAKFFAANDNLSLDGINSTINLIGDNPCMTLIGDLSYSFGSLNFIGPNARLSTAPISVAPLFNETVSFSQNGTIFGDHAMRTLSVANQYTLFLENGSRQAVEEFITVGDECEGDARVVVLSDSGPRANIAFQVSQVTAPIFFRGIEALPDNRTISVFGGFNGGNNSDNLTFTGFSRNLFWVGDNGDWDDPNNWSRVSGGVGGECIPRSVDNVFFDMNSFPGGPGMGFSVTSALPIFLNSFTFEVPDFSGTVDLPSLTINADNRIGPGSEPAGLTIDAINLNWQIDTVFLVSADSPGMTANTDNLTVSVSPNVLNNVVVSGQAGSRVRLGGDFVINGDLFLDGEGEFSTQGFDVEVAYLETTSSNIDLSLSGSMITIRGSFDGMRYPVTLEVFGNINAGDTRWILLADDTGISVSEADIGDVISQSNMGTTRFITTGDVTIGTLQINNDGAFGGVRYDIDSLILTPAHTYELGTGVDVTVAEYLEGRGDQCSSVIIISSGAGMVEEITLDPSTSLVLSYLEITNVQAGGGGSYFAGPGSTGTGDTSGWTFPSEEDNLAAQNYLGLDPIVACSDSTITLSPFTLSEVMSIEWEINRSATRIQTVDYTITPTDTEVIAHVITPSGCEIPDTIEVDISPEFSLIPQQDRDVCQGASTTLDPGFSDPTAVYSWSTGADTETITVNATDEYIVEVQRGACVERDSVVITRIDLEPFDDVFMGRDTVVLCEDETITFSAPDFTNSSFVWSDGSSNPTIQATSTNQPQDNLYFIEVTEGACTDRDSIIVTFDSEITQILTNMMDTTICQGAMVELSTIPGFDSIFWNTGERGISIPVDPNNDRTYVVEAFRGACVDTEERNVFVTPVTPIPLGADITICETEELRIAKPANLNLPLVWIDSASNAIITAEDTLDVPIVIGRSAYILEADDNGCPSRDTVGVEIQQAPIFDLNTGDTTICIGEDIMLAVVPETDVDYTWSTGDLTDNIVVSESDAYLLTAERGQCSVDTTIIVDVLDLGAFSIGPPDTTLCRGDILTLDATLGGSVTYEWSPQSGNPTFEVSTDGDYSVVVSSGNCTVMDAIMVAFDDPAVFDLHQIAGATDTIICEGTTLSYPLLSFNDAVWSTIDGTEISTDINTTLSEENTYELLVRSGVCETRDTIALSIQELPELNLTPDIQACEGEVISLETPASANVSYLWSTNETTDFIEVTMTDVYTVTADDGRCQNSASSAVNFNALPSSVLPSDASICDGDSLLLFDIRDLDGDLAFNGPAGTEDITSTQLIFARANGQYILNQTNAENCTQRDTLNFVVHETPFFTLPDSTGLCDGNATEIGPTYLNAQPVGATFRWSNADGNEMLTVRSVNQGSLWLDIMLDNADGTCSWSDTTFVDVQAIPDVDLDPIATICSDSTLVLDATTPGVTYLWSTGETTPTIEVSEQDVFTVTVDIKGCTDMSQTSVTTIPTPIVDLGMDTTICEGDMIVLSTNSSQTSNILWSTGDNTTDITVTDAMIYSVRVEENGCSSEDEITLTVEQAPQLDLGEDIAICDQVGATLTIDLPDVDVLWSTGESGPSINVNSAGTIDATVINSFGCEATDEVEIIFRECQRFGLYQPNIFMPGGQDEANQTFFVTPTTSATINSFEMSIFNRWGNLVFTTTDITEGWDGLIRGSNEKALTGVYVYSITINYTDDFDPSRTDIIKGDVTLIAD